jgi:hypothetical protein
MTTVTSGSVAVANVQGQITLVQGPWDSLLPSHLAYPRSASRPSLSKDGYIDVETFTPFGPGVFITSDVPSARIASSSLLAVLPPTSYARRPSAGVIELPGDTLAKFTEMNAKETKRHESLWKTLKARLH